MLDRQRQPGGPCGVRVLRRLGLVLAASAFSISAASADEAADFSEALSKAATAAVLADAYMAACDLHDPDSEASRRDVMAGWSHRVDLLAYGRLLAGASEQLPELAESLEQHTAKVREAISEDVAGDRSVCGNFAEKFTEDVFDVSAPIRYLLRNADDFGIEIAEAPVAPSSEEIEIVPLVMLSAQLADKMDEVGSKSGARENRDMREAREEHATAWLQQRPVLAVYGRVLDDSELREWRGDQQSAFYARCTSFADDSQEADMQRDLGENRIIVGEVRWLRDDREGGVIGMGKCHVFVHDPAEAELASIADDSKGLMLRPPEYGEAFAGPGEGIDIGEIDRVLYDAEFENRMDGFGNGYTHRSEDIYVLLRDGTAYRHAWNFAFTDLDVALSRQREPDRWFTWRDSWGSVTITQTGGLDAGQEIDLTDARRLMPVPSGQRLDQTYYYLNVGMGGGRSDRDYAFSADGELVHTRGGFVAGNFGTSYIVVVGDDDVATSRYSFDGYTLLIEGPGGQERHFVALFDGDDPGRPEEIIIDGQVHWLRESDD